MRENEIIKLSASSCKTYDQCPKKYYFQYIAKMPRQEWDHLYVGNLCHLTLENFHQALIDNPKIKPLPKLMGKCFSDARAEMGDNEERLILDAKSMLTDYLKSLTDKGMPNVDSVEKSFVINMEPIMVRGFIDRIDILDDGTIHVVDYKTTKNQKFLEPFQLLVYGLALKQFFPDLDKFKASYVLLRHKSAYQSYNFNQTDLDTVKKDLIKYAGKISTENTWQPMVSPLCNYCDFKNICEAAKAW